MAYSIVGILAFFVLFVVNMDIIFGFRGRNKLPGEKYYLIFLLTVALFHASDAFWGVLYDNHLTTAVFIDATAFFITMAASIFLWCLFVYHYVGEKRKIIIYASLAVFLFQVVAILLNIIVPVIFTLSEDCVFKLQPGRYVMLGIQVLMYLLLAVYALLESRKKKDRSAKRHCLIVGLFSLFMMVTIIITVSFPFQPVYSCGYLFGLGILHALVIEDERSNSRVELAQTRRQMAVDELTGTYSKHSYIDMEADVDDAIDKGTMEEFAMVVFDLNDLRIVNEKMGREAGDKFIIDAVKLIEDVFKDAQVYRVGGDEFTVLLKGHNYMCREKLLDEFNRQIDINLANGSVVVVAAGMSSYMQGKDTTILHIFTRADREMFARKHQLKEKHK